MLLSQVKREEEKEREREGEEEMPILLFGNDLIINYFWKVNLLRTGQILCSFIALRHREDRIIKIEQRTRRVS